MTEYKLVPIEPTEKMSFKGSEEYATNPKAGVREVYKAMTADAPTVQEVDLRQMSKEWIELYKKSDGGLLDFDDWIIQKHGKLYAVKEVRDD